MKDTYTAMMLITWVAESDEQSKKDLSGLIDVIESGYYNVSLQGFDARKHANSKLREVKLDG